jgi:hypothetical protein
MKSKPSACTALLLLVLAAASAGCGARSTDDAEKAVVSFTKAHGPRTADFAKCHAVQNTGRDWACDAYRYAGQGEAAYVGSGYRVEDRNGDLTVREGE